MSMQKRARMNNGGNEGGIDNIWSNDDQVTELINNILSNDDRLTEFKNVLSNIHNILRNDDRNDDQVRELIGDTFSNNDQMIELIKNFLSDMRNIWSNIDQMTEFIEYFLSYIHNISSNNDQMTEFIENSLSSIRNISSNDDCNGDQVTELIDNILSNDDQVTELIGKIVVSRRKIGKGSNGTVVYKGKYDGRLAAVKCLVRACFDDDVSKEIDILIKSDRHENIVRYYGVEKRQHFVYLALELCTCSLDDLIQAHSDSSDNSAFPGDPASMDDNKIKLASIRSMMQKYSLWQADGYPSRLLLKLMRDMVLGLSHLHDLRIIHRDLKPQNVLIAENRELVARLSDMGISRCLPEDKSSLGYPATGCGTSGWRAPEVLRSGGRQTLAMDLFSLGCVLFFCITCGKHPFGDNIVRDSNILDDKKDLSRVEFIPEAHDLILHLLNREPKLRPKASEVLHHPFFWSSKTRLSFLSDVSNKVEFETKAGNLDLLNALESTAQSVYVGNWEDKIERAVRAELWRRRRYDGSLVRHLLRAVRNVYSHHMEFPEEVKEILGPVAGGLDAYFAIRFPRLLIESYRVVSQICIRKELLAGVLSK